MARSGVGETTAEAAANIPLANLPAFIVYWGVALREPEGEEENDGTEAMGGKG
jgi:hypothetical protein